MSAAAAPLRTERLLLIPATITMLEAAIASHEALAAALGADVPNSWPPDLLDSEALAYTINQLQLGEDQQAWWMYFVCTIDTGGAPRLIGSVGYKGPPLSDGTVEVGYGIVGDHQRRGFATEATRALLVEAFSHEAVKRVIAETLPILEPSIGVLKKVGFSFVGQGSLDGVIRFEMSREAYLAAGINES